eukprot:s1001_g11.t1
MESSVCQTHGAAAPSKGRANLRRAAVLTLLVAAWPQTNFQLCTRGTLAARVSSGRTLRTRRAAITHTRERFRWGERYPQPEPPPFPPGMDDPLPWPVETAEIMIDAHSVIPWYWAETAKIEEDLDLRHDKFSFWPARIAKAGEALLSRFGLSRPPSPWSPIITVFDLPDPGNTWNGQQIKRYRSLARQGPRQFNNVTLAAGIWMAYFRNRSMSEPDGAEEFEDFEVPCEGVVSIDAAAMASATAVDEANLSSVAVEGDAPDFGMGAKRTVSALMLPPQRQDSANSIHSIMEVVRERVGKLQGTLAGGLLTGGSEGDDWNPRSYRGSPRTNRAVVSQEAADFCMISPRRAMFPWSDTPRRTLRSVGTTPATWQPCGRPVFVPLALFSLEAQQAVFASYTHSVQTQKELISSIVLNATQWVLLEASKSVEKAVFVGIVEPPDCLRLQTSTIGACDIGNNNLCSGRSLSLYAAMDTGEVSGAAFRPRFWGTSLAQEAPFLADAPAGSPTNLSVFEASGLIGDRGAVYLTRPYLSAVEPFYEVQAKLANESLRSDAPINSRLPGRGSAGNQPVERWIQLYFAADYYGLFGKEKQVLQ